MYYFLNHLWHFKTMQKCHYYFDQTLWQISKLNMLIEVRLKDRLKYVLIYICIQKKNSCAHKIFIYVDV